MHLAPVDRLSPDWVKDGLTIGDARGIIDRQVRDALEWHRGHSDPSAFSDETLHQMLTAWFFATAAELERCFSVGAHALRFRAAFSVFTTGDRREILRAVHSSCSRALADASDHLASERARLAQALEALQAEVARHGEIVGLIRQTSMYSEAVWQKVVIDPLFASPITALMNNGIAQSAIWDVLKATAGWLAGR